MYRNHDVIVNLADARLAELSPFEEGILRYLEQLRLQTLHTQAKRFRGYIAQSIHSIPASLVAKRALKHALRVGVALNCLHPTPATASYWQSVHEAGGIPLSTEGRISDEGLVEFIDCQGVRTERRRKRLTQLPEAWLEDSLELARRCNPVLRAGILVTALSGCRPSELKGINAILSRECIHLKIKCSKDSRGNPLAPPRYRDLYFSRLGSMAQWVTELANLLETLPQPFPFENLSAKSVENGLARISKSMLERETNSLTASCYRNQFSADLKRDGHPEAMISYCMGHVCLKTKSKYGTYHQGKSGRRGYLSADQSYQERAIDRERQRY